MRMMKARRSEDKTVSIVLLLDCHLPKGIISCINHTKYALISITIFPPIAKMFLLIVAIHLVAIVEDS